MRALVLLCAGLVLSGCSTTETLSRADPGGLARLDQYARDKTATVHLVTGEASRGRVEFVRADSTAWHPREGRRAAATDDVVMVVRDPRGRNAGIGLAIGAGIGTVAVLSVAGRGTRTETNIGGAVQDFMLILIAPVALTYGPVIGAFAQPKRTWILSDVPPASTPAP